jgi:riboflavin kinase/FMN adenylyltransferase
MLVEEELARVSPSKGMVLTIGVFDGVHLGHKYLLSRLKEQARQQDSLSGVVTFRRHPQETLSPRTKLSCLTTLTERARLLKDEGIDEVIVLSFNRKLAELSAQEFVSLLQRYVRMQGLVIGPDFALGRRREGNTGVLRALGQDMNFTVTVISPIMINGEVVSSTSIRSALASGDMKKVNSLTGRYFSVSGRVITGAHRGAQLGFPTANLEPGPAKALPVDGVYATWAYMDNTAYESMTYIGKNPTFGNNQRSVEVYILDYQGDLYNQELKIDIIERLRGDKQFNTAEELVKQIAEDVKQGRTILASQGRN